MSLKTLKDCDLTHKRVLIREDFNVPMRDGVVTNQARLIAAKPTIEAALAQGAAVILLSHLGRPSEGEKDAQYSLRPVADALANLLQQPVKFAEDWLSGVDVQPGEIVLCENVRFNRGEKNNDQTLAKQIASLCDVFVMDAFASAHRAHASTVGVAQFAPMAVAGPLLAAEISALGKALHSPVKPVAAIVAGSKVSSKLLVLEQLLEKVDQLIVGGGIANTFLAAQGFDVGQSLMEAELIPAAGVMIKAAEQANVSLPLPVDVVVADKFAEDANARVCDVEQIQSHEMILDIGPKTRQLLSKELLLANTIVWNGPVGVFEFDAFSEGTKAIAQAIAQSHAFSIAGGGDTLAAIDKFNVREHISYISTGGGAFLEFMEGKSLPAIEVLQQRQG